MSMDAGYVKVGKISDFPEGELKKVSVGREDVAIATVMGKIYAITGTCTHRGGPLHEGELKGTTIVCPWHGGEFDITTGKVVGPPPMKDETPIDVRIEVSEVFLRKKMI